MSHTVQVLVETYKANVNHKNYIDQTPLHCAVFSGSLPCVKTLLDLNADIHARNIKQKTPVDLAEELNQKLIIEHFAARIKYEMQI
uniref:ANK_REP_REGION domain-containing protein n=2 Tax=Bursaphelenchus xylophilus TaxID=6326 RepID=A0A1I7SMP1_BURXY